MAIRDTMKRLWNAFVYNDQEAQNVPYHIGPTYGVRPDRIKLRYSSERSIVSSIYTRISIDYSSLSLKHVKLDDQLRYYADISSKLNEALTYEPNLDQSPRAFRQDIAMTLFDKGVAAIVPIDTIGDPTLDEKYDILTLRVGEVVDWYPRHVRVSVYNVDAGKREEILLEKSYVSIIENPLYAVMNEPNSTLQRLIRKLNLLDAVDEQSGSGKLDLIIQLPYAIKTEARRLQAESRREDIEMQLRGSQYGIAYTDGTEKITQLNRPAENNLLKQIEYLTNMLYSQLGLTEEVMNGTADEKTMLNYISRTIEPLIDATVESMQRAFLGRKRYNRNERIKFFQNPFKLVPVNDLAEIADKFTRNEILTANEIRAIIGLPPADDPKADKLINSNMPEKTESSGT